jgi:hypothetical protein
VLPLGTQTVCEAVMNGVPPLMVMLHQEAKSPTFSIVQPASPPLDAPESPPLLEPPESAPESPEDVPPEDEPPEDVVPDEPPEEVAPELDAPLLLVEVPLLEPELLVVPLDPAASCPPPSSFVAPPPLDDELHAAMAPSAARLTDRTSVWCVDFMGAPLLKRRN